MSPWITVIGFGEDGLEALSPVARALIDGAEVLVGGERHLAKVPPGDAQRMSWGSGFAATLDEIAKLKGRRVTVLASGDPMDYGAGTALACRFPTSEMTVVPAPGAFSLACARMAWSRPDVETLTVHGRPLEKLLYHVAPGTRLLVLSQDGDTPAVIAALLSANGYGPSPMTVLEHLNGTEEKRLEGIAEDWSHPRCADLNTVAVECRAGPGARLLSRVPGLPDDAFEHDGQITKREVRAATLAALVPLPAQMLWDIGAGSGAVAIEWLRAERSAGAVAIERDPARAVLSPATPPHSACPACASSRAWRRPRWTAWTGRRTRCSWAAVSPRRVCSRPAGRRCRRAGAWSPTPSLWRARRGCSTPTDSLAEP